MIATVKMRHSLCLLSVLFFLLLPFVSRGAGATIPGITVGLDRDRLAAGRTARLEVAITWEGAADEFDFNRPEIGELSLVSPTGSSSESRTYLSAGRNFQVRRFLFDLQAEEAGSGEIGPITVIYRRKDGEDEYSLRAESLPIKVVPLAAGFIPLSLRTLLIAAAVIVGAALFGLYIVWTVKRYRKKSSDLIEDYIENLEEITLAELDRVGKYRVSGDLERYYREIARILNDYLDKKYSVTISADGIRGGEDSAAISDETMRELDGLAAELTRCRFGDYPANPTEQENLLKKVYRFINEQKGESDGYRYSGNQ